MGSLLVNRYFNYANDINTNYEETEQFTEDIHWMPNVVLMAKKYLCVVRSTFKKV